jgi:hypothetical protein
MHLIKFKLFESPIFTDLEMVKQDYILENLQLQIGKMNVHSAAQKQLNSLTQ